MSDELRTVPPSTPEGNPARPLIAVVAAMLIGGFIYFAMRSPSTPPSPSIASLPQHAPLSAEERAYLPSVAVDRLEISRAENFLHQEVTTVAGQITNSGARPLASLQLTIEFSDQANQVTQREVREVLAPPAPPIPPGAHQNFEVSFEHISAMWNMQPPTVKVSAIHLLPSE